MKHRGGDEADDPLSGADQEQRLPERRDRCFPLLTDR